ncbi:MAG: HDOD domain-containing protein [Candidatus Sumerlaeota bacterium]|nr:HDOD domain-containing protein [Candidatus Sumerlaeota bacterium]
MIPESVRRKLINIGDLPTLPVVVTRILETVQNDRSSSQDLTEVIEEDYSISARVLRLANSAFYGVPNRVDSIRRAIVLIGFDAVKMLALASSVFDAFSGPRVFALEPEDFWLHSLGAAKASHLLCARYPMVAPDGCFTASLLHDLGKIILSLTLKEEYDQVVRIARDACRNLKDVEMEELTTNHAEVGEWIARKWHFPPMIVEAIATLYERHDLSKPHQTDAAIVALSDKLARMADFGLAGDLPIPPSADALRWNELGLSDRDMEAISQELNDQRSEVRELLALITL